jgi:hypothetical protein
MASPYHHVILPLASRRDKITEVRWGMADFRRRFGREPEGMWLPEAAVDMETLEVLADEGIRFTLLGPDQVDSGPAHGQPGRVDLGAGKSIAVFVYDGGLSHDVAFGKLLKDADGWVARMAGGEADSLSIMATDGETFGHHHKWADMALAAVVARLAEPGGPRLENLASFLARSPARAPLTIVEPSSWSCAHGVERWRSDCGCKMAPHLESQQVWRTVLRDALNQLSSELHARFEDEASGFFLDPAAVRDDYAAVLDAPLEVRRWFVEERAALQEESNAADSVGSGDAGSAPSDEDVTRALELLEMERDALRMFTSCGWFFDDIAGLEPLQVLRYAAHALQLLGPEGAAMEERLLERLAEAKSNDPDAQDAARLWQTDVLPGAGAGSADSAGEAELTAAVRAALADPGRTGETALMVEAFVRENRAAPFQTQTVFWDGLEAVSPDERAAFGALAEALGFSDAALSARPLESSVGGASDGLKRALFGPHPHPGSIRFHNGFRPSPGRLQASPIGRTY